MPNATTFGTKFEPMGRTTRVMPRYVVIHCLNTRACSWSMRKQTVSTTSDFNIVISQEV